MSMKSTFFFIASIAFGFNLKAQSTCERDLKVMNDNLSFSEENEESLQTLEDYKSDLESLQKRCPNNAKQTELALKRVNALIAGQATPAPVVEYRETKVVEYREASIPYSYYIGGFAVTALTTVAGFLLMNSRRGALPPARNTEAVETTLRAAGHSAAFIRAAIQTAAFENYNALLQGGWIKFNN